MRVGITAQPAATRFRAKGKRKEREPRVLVLSDLGRQGSRSSRKAIVRRRSSVTPEEAGRLVEVVFVEDACTTQLLERVLHRRCCPSVAKAFRRLFDAEAEGPRRHVCAPAELLDALTVTLPLLR